MIDNNNIKILTSDEITRLIESHKLFVSSQGEQGSKLSVISKCKIENADFTGIKLDGIIVQDCIFVGCDFSLSQLNNSAFESSSFRNVKFKKSMIVKSEFFECVFDNVIFDSSQLNRTEFTQIKHSNTSYIDSDLQGASFDECDLRGVKLTSAVLGYTHLFNCVISNELAAHQGIELNAN